MRTFQYSDAKSNKFWNIAVSGSSFTVTFGRVGSPGQTQTKTFASAEQAQAEADKLIRQKLGKGYTETTPKRPASEAEAFELALAADPHDLAGRCAYADYLAERGDPRGEFMQVQLALEEERRPEAERRRLQVREKELLQLYERDWLGSLVAHLLDDAPRSSTSDDSFEDGEKPATEYRWRRGFLTDLKVQCLTVALAQALVDAPEVRFLETLHVVSTAGYLSMQENQPPRRVVGPPQHRGDDEWLELLGAPLLRGLRIFQMGDIDGEPPEEGWMDNHTYAPGIERPIAEMPRIEELHLLCKEYDSAALFALPNLTNLRMLRMYALGNPSFRQQLEIPLEVLARNPALGKLTHLMLHPHFADDESFIPLHRVVPVFQSPHLRSLTHLQLRLSSMGDEGVREIVASGILKRLKWLDLRHGCITDEGARAFAACSETRNLDRLDLSRNAVTAAGLDALRLAGIKALANNPLTEQELANQEYLHEGDFE
jgi:uncharacterized protein (TIGR02996 family)